MANGKSMFAEAFVSRSTTLTSGETYNVQKYRVHEDEVYERRIVHRFKMGDVEDPEIYVAQPIYEWQQSEQGKWVMKNGLEHQYHLVMEPVYLGYLVTITAHITPKRWTEYCLRFPVIS